MPARAVLLVACFVVLDVGCSCCCAACFAVEQIVAVVSSGGGWCLSGGGSGGWSATPVTYVRIHDAGVNHDGAGVIRIIPSYTYALVG